MYKGVAAVPSLFMVDDIRTISKCSPTAIALNSTVNAFMESKKLTLSHKKCLAIHVRKYQRKFPDLKIHKETMHRGESSKYLGELFHNSGKSKYNIIERNAKAHGILAEILQF